MEWRRMSSASFSEMLQANILSTGPNQYDMMTTNMMIDDIRLNSQNSKQELITVNDMRAL